MTSQSSHTMNLRSVPFTHVKISDAFWSPRQETNRKVSIPHSFDMLEKSGNMKDLDLAGAGAREGYMGPIFIDSDLYKAIEGASYSLAAHPDPKLEKRVDEVIAKIVKAQMPDGYLNTWFQVNAPDKRWRNLRDEHELYCAGHLVEAAVAHHAATGKRTLLDVAIKFADLLDKTFGNGPGKRMGYPGHPETELALIKLADATGEKRYFELARFFLDNRGSKFFGTEHGVPLDKYNGEYWQDHAPIRKQDKIVGHAVRAAYLMSGATDLAARTGDTELAEAVGKVWKDATETKMYVTGGVGNSAQNEGFTVGYDLPNETAYQETCASIAMAMWNHRLNLLHADARYADFLERALYNGVLSGVSLDGKKFFYENKLASDGTFHRPEWFGCACCPPNITRTLAQIGGYAYAKSDNALWVNLYIQGEAQTEINGSTVKLAVKTDYPWNGDVELRPELDKPAAFQLRLRQPGWCKGASVAVNGESVAAPTLEKGYIVLNREWKSGDTVKLTLPMPVERIAAHPAVKQDHGRLAIQRGPVVYCIEQCDNEASVPAVAVAQNAVFKPEHKPDLLNGVTILTTDATVGSADGWKPGMLYAPAQDAGAKTMKITAIPYCVWDNREAGPMAVWLPTSVPVFDPAE